MKKILSLLLCYVFLQTETFALRGGPGGNKKLSGAYSGIITQVGGGADIGLFLLNATSQGASSGQIAFFSQSSSTSTGRIGPIGPIGLSSGGGSYFYSGTMTGLTNPNTGDFTGVFTGSVAATTGTASISLTLTTRTIAGSIKLAVQPGGRTGQTQQISGTASAQAETNGVTGPLKQYTVAGWQTSTDAVSGGFPLSAAGG